MNNLKVVLNKNGSPNDLGKEFLDKLMKGFCLMVPSLLKNGIKPYQIMMWLEGRLQYVCNEASEQKIKGKVRLSRDKELYSNISTSSLEDMLDKISEKSDKKNVTNKNTTFMRAVFAFHDHYVIPLIEEYANNDCDIQQIARLSCKSLRFSVHGTISDQFEKRKSGIIPLWTEDSESIKDRKAMCCPLEDCVFCQVKTSTWHMNTNNPICLDCATFYKVDDIPEDFGKNIRAMKRKGTFDIGDSVRAN